MLQDLAEEGFSAGYVSRWAQFLTISLVAPRLLPSYHHGLIASLDEIRETFERHRRYTFIHLCDKRNMKDY